MNEIPWSGALHYSIACDWVSLEVLAPSSSTQIMSGASIAALVTSFIALGFALAAIAFVTAAFWITHKKEGKFVKLPQTEENL